MSEPILVSEGSRPSNSRALKLLVLAGVLLLLGLVVPKVLFGNGNGGGNGGGGDATAAASPPTTTAVAPGEVPAEETVGPFSSKNPFAPLVADAPPAAAASPVSPGVVPASSGTAVPETVPAAPVPMTSVAPAPTVAESPPAPRAPARFGLVAVRQDADGVAAASVRIDGAVFDARVGQDVGGSYRVVKLDVASRCGEFLFGDQRFSLCEGEETWT